MNDDIQNAFARIKQRIEVQPNGCWKWLGTVSKDMYGHIRVGEKVMATHRVAYMAVHGAIPRGKVMRHQCDNRMCCNPDHVIPGDHEDNTQDIVDRNRQAARRVLTAEELAQVSKLRAEGKSKRQIAEALSCNWYTVSAAIDSLGIDGGTKRKPGRPKGSSNAFNRITDAHKSEMRDLYATGQFTQQQLAERFGCDQTYVSLIVRGVK